MLITILIFLIVVAALAYIWIGSGPKIKQTEETNWLIEVPIAHRGLHTKTIPENSMTSFQRAIDAGYAIELDVMLTSDDEVIVFHDDHLERLTGIDAPVSELTWDDIQMLTLCDSEETIPTLKDVLKLVDGAVPLLIEVKNKGKVGKLEQAVIELLEKYEGVYAIQAFNPFVLQYFKKHAPHMVRGQLSSHFRAENLTLVVKVMLRYLMLNIISEPSFVSYEKDSMPAWLKMQQRRKNVHILAWTVTNADDRAQALAQFDNIIFEGFDP